MDKIVVCTLINGREIVGTVVEETETSLTLDNAIALHAEVIDGQLKLAVVPVSPVTSQGKEGISVTLYKKGLSFVPQEPSADFIAHYKRETSIVQTASRQQVDNIVRGGFTKGR